MQRRFFFTAAVAVAVAVLILNPVHAGKAQIGKPAPGFQLKDQKGQTVALAQFKGKIVVLEWTCADCPVWRGHHEPDHNTMLDLAHKYKDKNVVWLGVNSTNGTTVDANAKAAEQFKIDYPILDDSPGKVGKEYDAQTTPHMFIINDKGVLVYDGAIDNEKTGSDAVNYVDRALGEILAAKPVSIPQTKPYGCGVDYRQ